MNRQMAKESPIASTESGRPAASQGHTSSTSNTHKTLPTLSRYASSGSNAGSANRTPSKPHASATGPFSFLQQTTSEAFPTSARSDSLFASSQAPNTGDFVSSNIAGGNTLRVSGEQPSTSSLFGTSIQSPFGASSSSPASVLGSFTPGTFVLPANSASPQNFGSSNDYRPAKIAKGVPPSHGGK